MLIASYIYTEEVALRANRELVRAAAPRMRYMPLVGLLIIFGPLLILAMNPGPFGDNLSSGLFGPVLFGAIFCAMPLLVRWQVRRQFRNNPNAGLRFTWQIDSPRLLMETQGASGVFEWSKLVRIKEARDGYLLFIQPKMANWLPKNAFESPADLEQFREYVRESGVKTP